MLTVETFATITEANSALREGSRFLAGGTLLMRAVNYGDQTVRRIVRTLDRDFRQIRTEASGVVIGAGATMADVMRSSDLAFLAPVARSIGGPAIRNMATVGGNLFAPHPYGDFAVALLALNARIRMADGAEMTIDDFLARRDQMRSIVVSVTVPRPMGGEFRYVKVSRTRPKGVSVMSIAAWLPRSAGRISGARIAFGAMGPAAMRAKAAESALEGATLDENGIQRALQSATEGLQPADDALASAWYRKEVAPVHLKRLLLGQGRR